MSVRKQQSPEPAVERSAPRPPAGAREIDGGDVDTVTRFRPGDVMTGVYRGYRTFKGLKDSESRLHKFTVSDGSSVGVWGTQQLSAKLDKVKEGENVWLGYDGKVTLPNGNSLHQWHVAVVPLDLPLGGEGDEDDFPF